MPKLDRNSHVLVTGATGLIGGEVVRHLLRHTEARVCCLVRGSSKEVARERLLERLRRSGEKPDPRRLPDLETRLEAIDGDIVASGLGLAEAEARRLASSVNLVIHSAADTSFLSSRRCRDTNIVGTENLLAFARACSPRPTFVHVSTACNVGDEKHRCLPEDDGCRPDNRHHNDYTHSKAIAERSVRSSGLDALIVRPSIVLSAGVPDPVFARQILWIAPMFNQFESLPIHPRARVDVVPVGYVAKAIVKLASLETRKHDCYHLSAGMDHSITMGEWIECINRHYGDRAPLRLPEDGEWTKEDEAQYLHSPTQRKMYFAMRHYLPFLNADLVFDNARLRSEVDVLELGLVPPTEYMSEVLGRVNLREALDESANP